MSVSTAIAAKPDFGSDGTTYQYNGQTLDFYSNGTVVYHANGSPVSRCGDWTVKDRGHVGGNYVTAVPIEVKIGDRTVTMNGTLNYSVNLGTNVGRLVLNGYNWSKQ